MMTSGAEALAATIHAGLTRKRDRLTCADIIGLIEEQRHAWEIAAFDAGRKEEREHGPARLPSHLRDDLARRLGPTTIDPETRQPRWSTLRDDADAHRIIDAMALELVAWRAWDRKEQARCERVGRDLRDLITAIRLLAGLVGQGQTAYMVGEEGPSIGIGRTLTHIAQAIESKASYDIQFPRWRKDAGHEPPTPALDAFCTTKERA